MNAVRHSAFPYLASMQEMDFIDESFVVLENDYPVCSAVRVNLGGKMCFFDQPFRLEFSSGFFEEAKIGVFDNLVLQAIWGKEGDIYDFSIELPLAGERTNRLLEGLLAFSSQHGHYVEGYLDFTDTGSRLHDNLRKSHRYEIRQTVPKLDEVRTYFGEVDCVAFDAFQALHFAAAGRVTRSQASWDEQRFAIEDRRASLTTVSFESEIIGATFSWLTPSSGAYASGAYDRSKFSQLSISHVSLLRAIEHAQDMGAKHYIVGQVFSPGGSPKERNIANFKRGFSRTRRHFHRLELSRGKKRAPEA